MINVNDHHSVYGEYDVIVSGGGLIGLTCATAIARTGRKVALVERRSALGWEIGRARRMFAKQDQEQAASLYIRELLMGMGDRPGDEKGFHAPFAELVFDRWAMEAKVDVMFHGWASCISEDNGHVNGLLVGTREGYQLLKAPLVIETDENGRLIDAVYSKLGLLQPIIRPFLIGNITLGETKELELSAGNRLCLRPLTQDQARVDIVLGSTAASSANHDFHAIIVRAIQLIREQVDGCADANALYLAEEAWRLPAFQLQEGFVGMTKPIGRLLTSERESLPTIELLSNHLASSRCRGLLLAGPWLPRYLAASSDSESKAVINRFLLGEAVAAFTISHSVEEIWGKLPVSS